MLSVASRLQTCLNGHLALITTTSMAGSVKALYVINYISGFLFSGERALAPFHFIFCLPDPKKSRRLVFYPRFAFLPFIVIDSGRLVFYWKQQESRFPVGLLLLLIIAY